MIEVWRAVPGWEGFYEVSDQGRVRSLDRTIIVRNCVGDLRPRRFRGRIMSIRPGKNGYLMAQFSAPNRHEYRNVHALVAEVFLGPPPEGQEVRHKDGVRANCTLSNLHYGTRQENALDRFAHGTIRRPFGEAAASAKLTNNAVRAIRASGATQRALGLQYGVSHSTIGLVVNRRSWPHI